MWLLVILHQYYMCVCSDNVFPSVHGQYVGSPATRPTPTLETATAVIPSFRPLITDEIHLVNAVDSNGKLLVVMLLQVTRRADHSVYIIYILHFIRFIYLYMNIFFS